MNRRTELTLGFLLGIGLISLSLLVWGQYTGQIALLGGAVLTSADVAPLAITPTGAASTVEPSADTQVFTENFRSRHFMDVQTSASWNTEAEALTLPLGAQAATAQSTKIADLTGDVTVLVRADLDAPVGSQVGFAVSHDGGTTWLPVSQGIAATVAAAKGDWRWRVILQRASASYSPAVESLSITFTSN